MKGPVFKAKKNVYYMKQLDSSYCDSSNNFDCVKFCHYGAPVYAPSSEPSR